MENQINTIVETQTEVVDIEKNLDGTFTVVCYFEYNNYQKEFNSEEEAHTWGMTKFVEELHKERCN